MINQRSIKPYEQQMPKVPVGIVPTGGRLQAYTAQQITTAKNPLPSTPANISNGRIYYGYYCLMCHGEKGDGNGPVGESYVPKPTDLSSPTVTSLNDGKLYQAMLHGLGHDPVMDETVQPEQRWPLVMYIRTFAKAAP
ncbi:MAG TPA: c-type cytochrome [Armatimonadota bacterium]|nr:c-type cytochrome [Armatimonadota bacterium]